MKATYQNIRWHIMQQGTVSSMQLQRAFSASFNEVSRILGDLVDDGFLTKSADGYQISPEIAQLKLYKHTCSDHPSETYFVSSNIKNVTSHVVTIGFTGQHEITMVEDNPDGLFYYQDRIGTSKPNGFTKNDIILQMLDNAKKDNIEICPKLSIRVPEIRWNVTTLYRPYCIPEYC